MHSKLLSGVVAFAMFVGSPHILAADVTGAPEIAPKEVRDLVGIYTGSWTMFGIDEKGEVVKRMAWTDVIKADNPEVRGDRAYVSTVDEMVFEGGRIAPFKIQGKEGYFLKKDGGLGEYFIETFGRANRLTKMGDSVWTSTMPATAQELGSMGFPKGASGQHVLVKVITKEQEIETHRISRLSTVNWKDSAGAERWLQFVSLQGFHKRQP